MLPAPVTPVAIIVSYLVVVTILGSLLARRVRTSRQWTVAGGGLGAVMLSAGLAGTRIGGAGTYGVAGNVLGSLGVFGPSRMEYPTLIPLVHFLGEAVSSALAQSYARE